MYELDVRKDAVYVVASGGIGDQLRIYWELVHTYPNRPIHITVSNNRQDVYSNDCSCPAWQTPNTKSNFIQELPLLFPNLFFDPPTNRRSTGLVDNTDKIGSIQEYKRDNIKQVNDLPDNFVFINLDCSNRFNNEHNPNLWLRTRKYSIEEEKNIQKYIKTLGYNVVSSLDRYFSILELPYVFEKSKYTIMVDSFCSILSLGLSHQHRTKMRVINKDLEGNHIVLNASNSLYKKFGIQCVFELNDEFEKLMIEKCI